MDVRKELGAVVVLRSLRGASSEANSKSVHCKSSFNVGASALGL